MSSISLTLMLNKYECRIKHEYMNVFDHQANFSQQVEHSFLYCTAEKTGNEISVKYQDYWNKWEWVAQFYYCVLAKANFFAKQLHHCNRNVFRHFKCVNFVRLVSVLNCVEFLSFREILLRSRHLSLEFEVHIIL